mmetsp:Transcript_13325/g.23595  ORF Transcript_13325/g.23595 Transcript_13325/m.23595 type:complete len:465 (-) Transcript_13325:220-1614(-)
MLRRAILPKFNFEFKSFRYVSSVTSPSDIYDVAIVGGGMVGAAFAALLANNPVTRSLRVAILDQRPQSTTYNRKEFPDLRVSTITPASISVIKDAGAWDAVSPPSASAAFSQMQVWDSAGPGHIRWQASDIGMQHMGIVVENNVLQAALLDAVMRNSEGKTDCIWPAEVKALRLPDGGGNAPSFAASPPSHGLAELALADGRVLTCRLVVAADGNASRIRSLADIRTDDKPYHQRGVVATVRTSFPSTTAYQRFLSTGPLALLPVRDGFSNIVWSVPSDIAPKLEALSPTDFAAAVNDALTRAPDTPHLLPAAATLAGHPIAPPKVEEWVGVSPKSFPLQLKHAVKYVLPRLALVGDAAHAIHPLAGQGVNLGLGDAAKLAEALAAARRSGGDVGSLNVLVNNYEMPQKLRNTAMIAGMDAIKTAFAQQAAPLALIRSIGLDAINLIPGVKNNLMRVAMGTTGF